MGYNGGGGGGWCVLFIYIFVLLFHLSAPPRPFAVDYITLCGRDFFFFPVLVLDVSRGSGGCVTLEVVGVSPSRVVCVTLEVVACVCPSMRGNRRGEGGLVGEKERCWLCVVNYAPPPPHVR